MTGDFEDENKRGIIPLSFEHIFQEIRNDRDHKYTVNLSFIQIYLETLQDLLEPSNENVRIREDPEVGVYLEGVEWIKVCNEIECRNVFATGEKNRITASTKMNSHSSRSHAILIVKIEKSKTFSVEDIKKISGDTIETIQTERIMTKSKLFLVDLAGSERVKKTKAESMRLEEAKKINYSLLVLGNCIQSLTDPKSHHVSYRDSKLTRLLQESLGGNAKTSLIVTISPSTLNVEETVSSLMFGQRAMKVQNKPIINKTIDFEALCIKLQEDLDKLNDEYTLLKVDYDKLYQESSTKIKSYDSVNLEEDVTIKSKIQQSKDDVIYSNPNTQMIIHSSNDILSNNESDVSISYSAIEEVKLKCDEEIKKLEDHYEEILKTKINEHEKILGEIDNLMLQKSNEIENLKHQNKLLTEKNYSLNDTVKDLIKTTEENKNLLEKKTNELLQLKKTNENFLKELKIEKGKNEKVKQSRETQTDFILDETSTDFKVLEISSKMKFFENSDNQKLDKSKLETIIINLYEDLETKNRLLDEKSSHFLKFLSSQKNKEIESTKNFDEIKKSRDELQKVIEDIKVDNKIAIQKIQQENEETFIKLKKENENLKIQLEKYNQEISSFKEKLKSTDEKISAVNKEKENLKTKIIQMKEIIETHEKENEKYKDFEEKAKKIQKLEDNLKNSYVQIQSYSNSEKLLKSSFNDLDKILIKTYKKLKIQHENLININKELKKIEKKKEIENFTSNNYINLINYDEKIFLLITTKNFSNFNSDIPLKSSSNPQLKNFSLLKSKSKSPLKNSDISLIKIDEEKHITNLNKNAINDINVNSFSLKCDEILNISTKIFSSYEVIQQNLLKIMKNYSQLIKNNLLNSKIKEENSNLNYELNSISYKKKNENYIKESILTFLKKSVNSFTHLIPQAFNEIENIFNNYDTNNNTKNWREISLLEFNKICYEIWDEFQRKVFLYSSGKDLEIEHLNERVIFLLRELEIYRKFPKSNKFTNEELYSRISIMENTIKLKSEENENLRLRIDENIKMIVKLKNELNSKISNDNSIILSTSNVTNDKRDLSTTENLMNRFLSNEDEVLIDNKSEIIIDVNFYL